MSLPVAALVHRIEGRARFRLMEHRGDAEMFKRIEEVLSKLDEVEAVRVNPETTSIVIHHRGALEEIVERARNEGLFELHSHLPSSDRVLTPVWERVQKLDADLRGRSHGKWDLNTVGFYGLVGAGLFQISRGKVLPAAESLLYHAFSLLTRMHYDSGESTPAVGKTEDRSRLH